MIRSAAVVLVLAVACSSSGDPKAAPTATEAPSPAPYPSAAPTMEPSPIPNLPPASVATAEPTPGLAQLTCFESRENAGLAFEYDPREFSRMEAVDHFCGQQAIKKICPETRYHSGKEYTHFPDERTAELSEAINCGSPVPQSAWTTGEEVDRLTGSRLSTATTIAVFHELGQWREDPAMTVGCIIGNDRTTLLIGVWLGGEHISGDYNFRTDVAYRFNDGSVIEDVWDIDGNELLLIPESDNQEFVRSLREDGELLLRVWTNVPLGYTQDVSFNLAGVDRDVEPVLQECGY